MAAARSIRRRRARNPWVRRAKRAAVALGLTFGVALSAGLAIYIPIYQEASDDALNIEKRLDAVKDEDPSVMYASDGRTPIYSVATIRRKVIDLNDKEMPTYVRYAIVAAEDRRFYDHRGVDPMGLARAVFKRGTAGGGSTIPMQLAKQLINGDARTPLRKLKDIATAQQIESLKSKDEILNLYANNAYYGQNAFGIQRAAQVYFGKDAKALTVGEAAMLARCVRTPSRINPVKNLEKMIPMRNYVLQVMLEEHWITQGQYDEGIHEVPKVHHTQSDGHVFMNATAGYFVRHVLSKLQDDFPDIDLQTGGYKIYTTLNLQLQKRAVDAVQTVLRENRGHSVNDGAIVVMDQVGHILAEVGGPDYSKRQYNVITQGIGRQPGSAFKAFVYTTALKNDVVHPGESISNAPISIQDGDKVWTPQNASPRENNSSYSLEDAFAYSINRPAIATIIKTGPENVVATARDVFGIKSHLLAYPSLALGTSEVKPLEMLEAYSVFMLGGSRAEPQVLDRVVGPDGEMLRKYDPVVHQDVLDPRVAQQMDDIMKGPVQYGTATIARDVPNARGKTGTTNSAKDAWFCGYSDGLVGIGWVGNTTIRKGKSYALPMSSRVFGGTVTVKIWRQVMLAAHNLKLANGVKSVPTTTISVDSAPPDQEASANADNQNNPPLTDEEIQAQRERRRARELERQRERQKQQDEASKTIVIDPTMPGDSNSDGDQTDPDKEPPVKGDGDGWDPTKEPPVEADKVDPPRRPVRTRRDRPRNIDRPRSSEEATEAVEVCVDTGMRASMYCPETVTKNFPKGRAPRRVCTLHHG